jgi:uncharacterized protein (TIGR03083 family)
MDADELLTRCLQCIDATTGQMADLVASIPDSTVLVPGSAWTLREFAAHMIVAGGFLTDIAQGTPSPMESLDSAYYQREMGRWNADIAETDPVKLSGLLVEAVEGFLDATIDVPGAAPVIFHGGFPRTVAGVAGVLLGELVLHGYDIASALGRPWPGDPVAAQLVLAAYTPALGLVGHREQALRLRLGSGLELRGVGEMTLHFVDSADLEESGEQGECIVSVDPVALLMVGAGRVSRSEFIALGLLHTGEHKAEPVLGWPDLLLSPRALRGFCTSEVQNPPGMPKR